MREMAYAGIHTAVEGLLPTPFGPALDLGAGTGAFATRLAAHGWDVTAADIDRDNFEADVPFHQIDLNRTDIGFEPSSFALIVAIEVIEHVEAPAHLLRTIAELLRPDGLAIVTTPNVESLPARVRFALRGQLRAFDAWGDPTHRHPVFMPILDRQLADAGLTLDRREDIGYVGGSAKLRKVVKAASKVLPDPMPGDTHILLLRRKG